MGRPSSPTNLDFPGPKLATASLLFSLRNFLASSSLISEILLDNVCALVDVARLLFRKRGRATRDVEQGLDAEYGIGGYVRIGGDVERSTIKTSGIQGISIAKKPV